MKPEFEVIPDKYQKSFTTRIISRDKRPLLSQAWHYHPEIEICYTLESSGKRFIGNNISNYEDEDLVLIGSNLPHGFTTEVKTVQYVIQLNENFLGKEFLEKPELHGVKALFTQAKRGLEFKSSNKEQAKVLIEKIVRGSNGLTQMIHLLELLNLLSNTKKLHPICSKEYSLELDISKLERIRVVYEYVINHYTKDIRVKDLADKINLTEAGFYKFIKKHTQKTLTQIINEFRINHATKLLMNSDKTIAAICFECGFNNLSFFNRKFKEIMGTSPGKFRMKYQ